MKVYSLYPVSLSQNYMVFFEIIFTEGKQKPVNLGKFSCLKETYEKLPKSFYSE